MKREVEVQPGRKADTAHIGRTEDRKHGGNGGDVELHLPREQ
jgi:hypothetical protein